MSEAERALLDYVTELMLNTGKRTTTRLTIEQNWAAQGGIVGSGATRDKGFFDAGISDRRHGAGKQRLTAASEPGLVMTHATRLAPRENHRAQVHAARRRMPSVRMRARKPPRPCSQSSAPGPRAEFIQ